MADPKGFPPLNLPPIRPKSNNTMNTDRHIAEKPGKNIELIRQYFSDDWRVKKIQRVRWNIVTFAFRWQSLWTMAWKYSQTIRRRSSTTSSTSSRRRWTTRTISKITSTISSVKFSIGSTWSFVCLLRCHSGQWRRMPFS